MKGDIDDRKLGPPCRYLFGQERQRVTALKDVTLEGAAALLYTVSYKLQQGIAAAVRTR